MLLLLAALLAPDPATTITLLVAGIVTICLALLRERRLARLANELADLLALKGQTTAAKTSLERTLQGVRRQLLLLAVVGELVIVGAFLFANLDITVARNYTLLLLVALAPLGLELELAALIHIRHKRSSETVRTAVGYAVEDARTLLIVVALSFAGTLWLHIPPALSALQMLFITCIARPLLSGRTLQATPHKNEARWRILFASCTVYGSFVFFFIRHYINPRFADTINPVTWQATTVALLVFVACQAILPLFNPKAPKIAVYRLLALLGGLVAVSYTPFLQSYFMTASPDAADWVWILIGGLFFAALVLLRQYSAQYNRKRITT
jgi:hypothetical protein